MSSKVHGNAGEGRADLAVLANNNNNNNNSVHACVYVCIFEHFQRAFYVKGCSSVESTLTTSQKCSFTSPVLAFADVSALFPPLTSLHTFYTHPHHVGDNGSAAQVKMMYLR